ncbi:MAG: hypothetical protein IH840_04925, partial [Candidatus Heimdallarchaeota archaeon]|nr:hypothetical protein [Candidatus Heimdallarchaeota archaeon]
MGKFTKASLSQWAEFECIRQLYLTLGSRDPNWMEPTREIVPLNRIRRGQNRIVLNLGTQYGQKIYRILSNFPTTHFRSGPKGNPSTTPLTKDKLEELYTLSKNGENDHLLLEYSFPITGSFLEYLFGVENDQLPVIDQIGNIIPDILIFSKDGLTENPNTELTVNGDLQVITKESDNHRIGINICDIKMSHQDSIGKKHFIEILYYSFALSHYLNEIGLNDKFYVNVHGNGILPNIENHYFANTKDFHDYTIQLKWVETVKLFTNFRQIIKNLYQNRPHQIEKVPLNIQPSCGRCNYLEDCKKSLGASLEDKTRLDLRLIPYTSQSISDQLFDQGFTNVGDVSERISKIQVGNTPEPIYAELPTLDLKSRALATQETVFPREGEINSVSIPKFTDISIIVNLEGDPINDRVFGFSASFNLVIFEKTKYGPRFRELWKLIDQYYNSKYSSNKPGNLDIELAEIMNFNKIGEKQEAKFLLKTLDEIFSDKTINHEFYAKDSDDPDNKKL